MLRNEHVFWSHADLGKVSKQAFRETNTHLTSIGEPSPQDAFGGEVDVDPGVNDNRVLAPELHTRLATGESRATKAWLTSRVRGVRCFAAAAAMMRPTRPFPV